MNHQVYGMDNRQIGRIDSESVHLIVTSPPYVTTEFRRGQEFDYDGFIVSFRELCDQLYRVTVPGGRFALNVADIVTKYRYQDENTLTRVPFGSDCLQVAMGAGFRLLERFIWDKGFTRTLGGPILGSYPYPLTLFNNNYFEYIFILRKPGKRTVKQSVREASQLTKAEWRKWVQEWWRIESITERVKFHRAVFPIEVPYRLIRMYSYEGDTVLDPFLGTGATMIAANRCNRSSIGFEIARDCRSMIEKRIAMEVGGLFESPPKYDFFEE
jgi:DNA modification methylase